jgi:hypothetical protein
MDHISQLGLFSLVLEANPSMPHIQSPLNSTPERQSMLLNGRPRQIEYAEASDGGLTFKKFACV